jgi:hypothetical protein
MFADTVEELHDMAAKIGLKRCWFQNKPGHQHYDLRETKRTLAIANGATPVTRRQMYDHFKGKSSNETQSSKFQQGPTSGCTSDHQRQREAGLDTPRA